MSKQHLPHRGQRKRAVLGERRCRFCGKRLPEGRRFFCEPVLVGKIQYRSCAEKFAEIYETWKFNGGDLDTLIGGKEYITRQKQDLDIVGE